MSTLCPVTSLHVTTFTRPSTPLVLQVKMLGWEILDTRLGIHINTVHNISVLRVSQVLVSFTASACVQQSSLHGHHDSLVLQCLWWRLLALGPDVVPRTNSYLKQHPTPFTWCVRSRSVGKYEGRVWQQSGPTHLIPDLHCWQTDRQTVQSNEIVSHHPSVCINQWNRPIRQASM